VQRAGFNAAFLFLAGVATFALGMYWVFMPETKNTGNSEYADASAPALRVA
jgi:predicted MFS family arabinose efflux permease